MDKKQMIYQLKPLIDKVRKRYERVRVARTGNAGDLFDLDELDSLHWEILELEAHFKKLKNRMDVLS